MASHNGEAGLVAVRLSRLRNFVSGQVSGRLVTRSWRNLLKAVQAKVPEFPADGILIPQLDAGAADGAAPAPTDANAK